MQSFRISFNAALVFLLTVIALITSPFISLAQENLLLQYQKSFVTKLEDWANTFQDFKVEDFKTDSRPGSYADNAVSIIEHAENYFSIYQSMLFYSPDKKHFIDIYSYQLDIQKVNDTLKAFPEVDQNVFLGNGKTLTQISFLGASNWIEKVVWIDNRRFVLLGVSLTDENARSPFILFCDMDKKEKWYFENQNEHCYQLRRYEAPELKNVVFD